MGTSLIYRSSSLYQLAIRILYGRHYRARYHAIAGLIPREASVLDLCCGPGILYSGFLHTKRVTYTGLDLNPRFIERIVRTGGEGKVWDLREPAPLPAASHVIMQASLYHFLPDPKPIFERMLAAAASQVIVAEPVRNLATATSPLLSFAGRLLTNPGTGSQQLRFTEAKLDSFFAEYSHQLRRSFLIPGGREKIYVFDV